MISGKADAQSGNSNTTFGNGTFLSPDDICRELDGARIHSNDVDWQIKVWGVHQSGGQHWVQISADAAAAHHDLVLHMTGEALVRDALESIEVWLRSVLPISQIIHVS